MLGSTHLETIFVFLQLFSKFKPLVTLFPLLFFSFLPLSLLMMFLLLESFELWALCYKISKIYLSEQLLIKSSLNCLPRNAQLFIAVLWVSYLLRVSRDRYFLPGINHTDSLRVVKFKAETPCVFHHSHVLLWKQWVPRDKVIIYRFSVDFWK